MPAAAAADVKGEAGDEDDEEDDDDDDSDIFDKCHEHATHLFTKTKCGIYFDLMQTFLSFFSCALFIASTYVMADDEDDEELPQWLYLAEVILVLNFTLDYLLHLYLAKDNR